MKEYKIYIKNQLVGTTNLEKADPPMGVVFGEIKPCINLDYKYIKNLEIDIAQEFSEDNCISTISSKLVKVIDENNVEIEGEGNQISGVDKHGYEISIFGIPYPFYEDEFPHHVKEYENIGE